MELETSWDQLANMSMLGLTDLLDEVRGACSYQSVHAQLRFNGWHLKEHMHLGRSCKRELLKVHVFEDSWIIFMGENTWDVSCMIHAFSR